MSKIGIISFLDEPRSQLKARSYRPTPTRERGTPKRGGKVRYLGIQTNRRRGLAIYRFLRYADDFVIWYAALGNKRKPFETKRLGYSATT